MAVGKLPGHSLWLEFSHDQYLRLSALARQTGQSRQAIVREWIRPHVERLPPAEFDGLAAGDDEE